MPNFLGNEFPKISVIGRPLIDWGAIGDYLGARNDAGPDLGLRDWQHTATNSSECLTEFGGRVCYDSFGTKQGRTDSAAYLRNILEQGHGSVLEHAVYNFLITGISRSLSHELVRHRAGWAYSQQSQRFVDEKDAEYVVPPLLLEPGNELLREEWEALVLAEHAFYGQMDKVLSEAVTDAALGKTLRRKSAREAARSVLPNAIATKIVASANIRAIRHFLEMRGAEHADQEIRRLAFRLLAIMQVEAPLLFGDYGIATDKERDSIYTPFRKV